MGDRCNPVPVSNEETERKKEGKNARLELNIITKAMTVNEATSRVFYNEQQSKKKLQWTK